MTKAMVIDEFHWTVFAPRGLPDQECQAIRRTLEAKGVILTAGNVGHMLGCTSGRMDLLMGSKPGQDRVFHYLPFCFAGSWIMLLTCLVRGSLLTLNSDLSKLSAEMRETSPNYFLNVPALLERVAGVVKQRDRVRDELLAQGWTVPPTQANFVWLRLGPDTQDFAAACERAGVSVRAFGAEGARISIGDHDDNDAFLEVALTYPRRH